MLNMDERAKRVKERQSRPRKSRTKAGCPWSCNTEAPTDDFYCIQTHTHSMSSSYEPWLLHEGARLKDLATPTTKAILLASASLSAHACTALLSAYEVHACTQYLKPQ